MSNHSKLNLCMQGTDMNKICANRMPILYTKQSTGGNDPNISKSMRYSQVVKHPKSVPIGPKPQIPYFYVADTTADIGTSMIRVSYESPPEKVTYRFTLSGSGLSKPRVFSNINGTYFTFTGLTANTLYTITMVAINNMGNISYPYTSAVRARPSSTLFSVTNRYDTSIRIAFSMPPPLVSINVYAYYDISATNIVFQKRAIVDTSAVIVGLQQASLYNIQTSSTNNYGITSDPNNQIVTTLATMPMFNITNIMPISMTIHFSEPVPNVLYKLIVSRNTGLYTVNYMGISGEQFIIYGLVPGASYRLSFLAYSSIYANTDSTIYSPLSTYTSSSCMYYKFDYEDIRDSVNIANYYGGDFITVAYDASMSMTGLIVQNSNQNVAIKGTGALLLNSSLQQYVTAGRLTIFSTGLKIDYWITIPQIVTSPAPIFELGNGYGNDTIAMGIDAGGYLYSYVANANSNIIYDSNFTPYTNVGTGNNAIQEIYQSKDGSTFFAIRAGLIYFNLTGSTTWSTINNLTNISVYPQCISCNYNASVVVFTSSILHNNGGKCFFCVKDPSTPTKYSYTFTQITDTTVRPYTGIAMLPDGSRIITCDSSGGLYFANSVQTTARYGTFTTIRVPDGSLKFYGIDVTNDGNSIVYGDTKYGNIYIAQWSGTTYNPGVFIDNVNANLLFNYIGCIRISDDTQNIYCLTTSPNGADKNIYLNTTVFNGTNYNTFNRQPITVADMSFNSIYGEGNYGLALSSNNSTMYVSRTSNDTVIYQTSVNSTTTKFNNRLTPTPINDGLWHRIVWSIMTDGTNEYYIDDTLVKTTTGLYPNNVTRTMNYFGKSTYYPQIYYNGGMDDFLVY